MRINQRLVCVLSIVAALAPSTTAFAWSNQGHMVTGAIAYDDLARTDPGLIATIEAIMANHPDKARFDRALAGFSGGGAGSPAVRADGAVAGRCAQRPL